MNNNNAATVFLTDQQRDSSEEESDLMVEVITGEMSSQPGTKIQEKMSLLDNEQTTGSSHQHEVRG